MADSIKPIDRGDGVLEINFEWAYPGQETKKRTIWFVNEWVAEAHQLAQLELVAKLEKHGIDILNSDVVFDKVSDGYLNVLRELPKQLKKAGSVVITDDKSLAGRLGREDYLIPISISSDLADLSKHFGNVGKESVKGAGDALDQIAVFETIAPMRPDLGSIPRTDI